MSNPWPADIRIEWLAHVAQHLRGAAVSVAVAIAKHANAKTGKAWPSWSTLATYGMNRRTVGRAIDQLVESGFLFREPKPGRSTVYTLTHGAHTTSDTGATSDTHAIELVAPTPKTSGAHATRTSKNQERTSNGRSTSNDAGPWVDGLFAQWWDRYGRKVGRAKARSKWRRLKPEERAACLAVVDAYVDSTPDPQYRPHPTTYLNGRRWEDEITTTKAEKNDADFYASCDTAALNMAREARRARNAT